MAIPLRWVEYIEAADLLVPQLLRVSQALTLRLIFPDKLDTVAFRAPERLFKLQEYLVSRIDSQFLNGHHLLLGQAGMEQAFMALLQDSQGHGHNDVVSWDELTVLALYEDIGALVLLGEVTVVVSHPLDLLADRLVPVDALDWLAELNDRLRDGAGQELHDFNETTRNDVMSSRDFGPFPKFTERHFIHAVGAALTTLYLREKQHKSNVATEQLILPQRSIARTQSRCWES